MMTYDQLIHEIQQKKSFLCVGLDPDLSKIPSYLRDFNDPILEFNHQIIDATSDLSIAYKPNLAFYECLGAKGLETLKATLELIPSNILKIADAKRGDIGNTAAKYAQTFFQTFDFDAVTVNPYMGMDTIEPYLEYEDKWVIVLAKTSNPGSSDFENKVLKENGNPLYIEVIERCLQHKHSKQIMFVVGAQNTEELRVIRSIAPDHFILVPGLGAQGGVLDGLTPVINNDGGGVIANYARQIIYAGSNEQFGKASRLEALNIQSQMASILATIV